MKHSFLKRLCSFVLATAIMFNMIPVSAFATDGGQLESSIEATDQMNDSSEESTGVVEEDDNSDVVQEENNDTENTEETLSSENEGTDEGNVDENIDDEQNGSDDDAELDDNDSSDILSDEDNGSEENNADEGTENEIDELENSDSSDETNEENTESEDSSIENKVETQEETENIISSISEETTVIDSFDDVDMTIVSDKHSTLAPGVTQREIVLYDEKGDRVEMYVAVADLSVDTVGIYANYKDNQNKVLGMSKTTEQVAAAEAKHEEPYSVVMAINASYYNMVTGKPTGTFVMEGNDITDEAEGNKYSFFAILNDGTPIIGAKDEYSSYKGQIAEAVGGYHHIVKDGAIYGNLDDKTKYPRQTIGITADGKVITMTADGNQAPKTIGLTIKEQAEVMLALGCVEAIHLDGGGSTTYACKPEGENTFRVINSPSDGSERSVSNSLMIVSRAVADGTFDHASLTAKNSYITPGTSVEISATGVDAAGNSAEIPDDAIWQISEGSEGSIVNGVFTSSANTGDSVVEMVYNDKVVGSVTIHVVHPQTIHFDMESIVVPFGKSTTVELTALYGVNEVLIKESDVKFTLEHSIGTFEGFTFNALSESEVTSSNLTVEYVSNSEINDTTVISLGKGSEVVFDFEDGTSQGVHFDEAPGTKYNYTWPESEQKIVSSETGKVHSGNHALGAKINYGNSLESGYMKTSVYVDEQQVFENAVRVGAWIYIPDECVGLWARWTLPTISGFNDDGTPIWGTALNSNTMDTGAGGTGVVYTFDEPGWHYLYADTSSYPAVGWKAGSVIMQFYISDRDGAAYNYVAAQQHNIPGEFQFYLDDITVDYSSAVDDREAPVFSDVTYATNAMADAVALQKNAIPTVTESVVSFGARVVENTTKNNYTGLNVNSAKAYIDGVEVKCTYANGIMSVSDVNLADGVHKVKFSICDNQGNYSSAIREIKVSANSGKSTIKVVPHDSSLDRILLGSLYYIDVVASDIENVDYVVTRLDLDSMSKWQLDHIEVAEGFKADYELIEEDKHAVIKITRTGEVKATGENILVSIPVRTWELKTGYKYPNGTKAGQDAFTYAQYKSSLKEFWPIAVMVEVDLGKVVFTDNTSSTFSSENICVDTEMWANYANMTSTTAGTEYYNNWNGGHIHSAKAITDKDAKCTENGYKNRTFCETCNSVVEWGTTLSATGHNYIVIEGVLKCEHCGELFTGTHEGVDYVDGIALVGWVNDLFYKDGVKLTGVHKVMAPDNSGEFYYNFGENGICNNKVKYTGVLFDEEAGVYRYSYIGELSSGWKSVGTDWYYFRSNMQAATGNHKVGGIVYNFEEDGRLTAGVWVEEEGGIKYFYGPTHYIKGWQTIEGERYYFEDCYRFEGIRYVVGSYGNRPKWYNFGENGAVIEEISLTGVLNSDYGPYVLENGESVLGLIQVENDYYCVRGSGEHATGSYYVSANRTNGLLPAGTYEFDESGKMLNGMVEKDGVLYNYVNGQISGGSGLIQIDSDYLYVKGSGEYVTGSYYISESKTNGLLPAGTYEFGADGKMLNGMIEKDGVLYNYVNGQIAGALGLIKVGEDYYYVKGNGQFVTGAYFISDSKTNGLLPAGTYEFGSDGKALNGMVEKDGVVYNYENGKIVAGNGLTKIGDDYYYVRSNGEFATGTYYITRINGYEGFSAGYYEFDSEGKALNGMINKDGVLYNYVYGQIAGGLGLIQVGSDYYYVKGTGAFVTGSYAISEEKANGLLPAGTYEFGADGIMLNGMVEKDGAIYNYVNGVIVGGLGLVEKDGAYYYISGNGQFKTGAYYVSETKANGLLPAGTYEFGADGKILNGIVEKDGILYNYVNGKVAAGNGLTKIGDDYYYVKSNGTYATGEYYITRLNNYPGFVVGFYTFGTDGKLVK